MDTVNVSLGVLASLTGKDRSELESALLIDSEDGKKEPKSAKQVDAYLQVAYKDKFDSVLKEKKDQIHQRARKEAFGEVEKSVKQLTGVDVKWNENGVSALTEYIENSVKNTKFDPSDVKKSEVYISDVTKLKNQLKAKDEEYRTQLKQSHKQRVMDKIQSMLPNIAAKDEYKFLLPKNEIVLKNNLKTAIQLMESEGYNIDVKEDGLVVLDKDGNIAQDESYNDISFERRAVDALKLVFDQGVNTPRQSTGTGNKDHHNAAPANTGSTYSYQEGENKKTVEFPKWESAEQFDSWYADNSMEYPSEVLDAAEKQFESNQE